MDKLSASAPLYALIILFCGGALAVGIVYLAVRWLFG
jgi:hypothetical protein